jgi:nicotinamidase-related amidase
MGAAVIVIDMLNPYEHPDAEPLKASVREVVPKIADLVDRARESDALVVYVNDCYEDWSASRNDIADQALAGAAPDLVRPLIPADDVPFVIKARHSIFYGTVLEYLLRQENIDRLILTGQVTEQCILYSALDGYVRRWEIAVAQDCVAHIDSDLAEAALRMMESNMRAHVLPGVEALEVSAGSSPGRDPRG